MAEDIVESTPVASPDISAPEVDISGAAPGPEAPAPESAPFLTYKWMDRDEAVPTREEAIAYIMDGRRFREKSPAWGRERQQFEERIASLSPFEQNWREIAPYLDNPRVQEALIAAYYGANGTEPVNGDGADTTLANVPPALLKELHTLKSQVASMTTASTASGLERAYNRWSADHPALSDPEKEEIAAIYSEIAVGNPLARTEDGAFRLLQRAYAAARGGMNEPVIAQIKQDVAADTRRAIEEDKRKQQAAASVSSGAPGGIAQRPVEMPKERGHKGNLSYATKILDRMRGGG